jgi:preprotein translocase subunit SecD
VQLPGIEDPNRIKDLLGKTARMTFHLLDESANPAAATPPPGMSAPAHISAGCTLSEPASSP